MSRLQKIIYSIIFFILIVIITICTIRLTSPKPLPTPSSQNSTFQIKPTDWGTVTDLVKNCQVKTIFEGRNKLVTIRAKDNTVYQAVEPKLDDIINLAQEYQGPCDIVPIVTE